MITHHEAHEYPNELRTVDGLQPFSVGALDAVDIMEVAAERIGSQGRPRTELPERLRNLVYRRDDYRCRWCGDGARTTWLYGPRCECAQSPTPHQHRVKQVPNLELDHIVPHAAGGCDHAHNLRVLCRACNNRRSNHRTDLFATALPVTPACTPCRQPHYTDTPEYHGFDYDDVNPNLEYDQMGPIADHAGARIRVFCGRCSIASWTDDPGSVW